MLENKRNIIIILVILSILILLPPLIHGYIYPAGGDASAEHLIVMERITPTHPIPETYLYSGQWIVGYPLVLLKTLFHIPLTVSFLWFNYLALIGVVLSFYFVFSRIFNKLAGIMSAVGIFVVQPFVLLFITGAIFDIVDIGIFVWTLYFAAKAWANRSWKKAMVSFALFFLFVNVHFNINSIIHRQQSVAQDITTPISVISVLLYILVVLLCGAGVWMVIKFRSKIFAGATKDGKTMMILLGLAGILLVIASAPMFNILPVQSRFLLEGVVLIFLLVMAILSSQIKAGKQADAMVMVVALVAGLMWLPTWLSDFSTIKPIDKQTIAYVNTLGGSQFYGNEYVAPWVYGRYLNKTYEPNSNIYIWRSSPMSGRTDPTSVWWWKPKDEDVAQPKNMQVLAKFGDKGVIIYVAEGN